MPTPLTPEVVAELQLQNPGLLGDYFDYLLAIGWGETESGRVIYSGPIEPDEIYGVCDEHAGIVLLGDDKQGFCFGYDTVSRRYGEISDDGRWMPWAESDTITRYVKESDHNAS